MAHVKGLLIAFNILCGGDSASTHVFINRGIREAVLPTQNPYAIHGIMAAKATGVSLASEFVKKRGNKKIAAAILIAGIVVEGYAVQHNVRAMR
jgi:hypothetical protein